MATAIAVVLGTLASLAVSRHRFFGRETISFIVVLPIALPGIVTGIALNDTFTQVMGIDLSLFTVIVGHATFCIVLVYNNVVARLRRVSTSLEEASADLGAHTWQTFRYVTLPGMRTALVAGALLAFALSFDEIIVTRFTAGAAVETLPIWIFNNLFRASQLPIINVVAVLVIAISIIPVYLAHRLTREEEARRAGSARRAWCAPETAAARRPAVRASSRAPARAPGAMPSLTAMADLPAVVGMRAGGVLLQRDHPHVGRQLDDHLGRRAEVDALHDLALHRDHAVLEVVEEDLLRAHRAVNRGALLAAIGERRGEQLAGLKAHAPALHRGREQVGDADEPGDEGLLGALVDLLGRARLLHPALSMTAIRSDIASASSWSWVT